MKGALAAAATWALLIGGLWLWGAHLTDRGASEPRAAAVRGPGSEAREAAPLPPAARPLTGGGPPRRLEIAALGVSADVIERGVDTASGGVDPPPFTASGKVGWYADGPTPGAVGPAVLVGHVDTEEEPAVFHRLREAEPGSEIRVTRQDGSVAEFTVRAVELVERDAFDADLVYGARRPGAAELRLITCGGAFDRERDSYSANVVVDAYLTGTSAAHTPA
ncbi:class F sortase [Streptomyces avicenniae]|uniref:class F sortase n=1 Tax=Streptomyces avicenniae TaxID=500153 RepID=UPI000699644B|nr:class F sortase [Streptomyces avicenniae]